MQGHIAMRPCRFVYRWLGDQSSSELDVLVELAGSLSLEVSLDDLFELSPRETWPEGDL
jgi:hypothetical protein